MGETLQILTAMIIYMAAVIILGVTFARKANASSDAYFLGGRSLGPWVTAMSAEASDMSGWHGSAGTVRRPAMRSPCRNTFQTGSMRRKK